MYPKDKGTFGVGAIGLSASSQGTFFLSSPGLDTPGLGIPDLGTSGLSTLTH